jgi:DNA-binding response OmpR family regulator
MADKKRILVVEDESSVLDILETMLVQAGYEVVRAVNGEEGLFRAKGHPGVPDLILTDIMMPKMDGFEMCSALKAERATRGIPVIFLTAKGDVRDQALGFGLGAQRYLVKPFTRDQVLEIVSLAFADLEERHRLAAIKARKHSGSLKDTSVHSLVELFTVNGWTGKVALRSGEEEGLLRFDKGKIEETSVGRGNNWMALEAMLSWKDGAFELERT